MANQLIRARRAFTLLLCIASMEAVGQEIRSRAEGQAYFDCTQDITWTADADLARTLDYDPDGRLPWPKAVKFIEYLNTEEYLGESDWRLPLATDVGNPGNDFSYCGREGVGDAGFWSTDSELAFMFYEILKAKPKKMGCDAVWPAKPGDDRPWEEVGTKAIDTSPFNGIHDYGPAPVPHVGYWYGNRVFGRENSVWQFHMNYGGQHPDGMTQGDVAWPVIDGDPLFKPGDLQCEDSTVGQHIIPARSVVKNDKD